MKKTNQVNYSYNYKHFRHQDTHIQRTMTQITKSFTFLVVIAQPILIFLISYVFSTFSNFQKSALVRLNQSQYHRDASKQLSLTNRNFIYTVGMVYIRLIK